MVHAVPALFLLVSAALAAPQQPAPMGPQKCSIEGLVVTADTGEPLKKAWLILRKSEGREQPYRTVTEASGRFLLKDIEAGQYRLIVQRTGYVRQEYGQRGPNRPGTILSLESGQQVRDVIFRLIRAAAITGRVYDEDGEPILGVNVQAMRFRYMQGQRQLLPLAMSATNDLGEYRLHSLPPGSYYISATYLPGITMAGSGAPYMEGTGQLEEQGYAPTYYPGTNDAARAVPLEIHAAEETSGINFTILPTRAVRIRGRVYNATLARPGRDTMVQLFPREPMARGFFFRGRAEVQDAQGSFELRGVVPGSYLLMAHWFGDGKSYSARLPIEVGASDVEGLQLVIAPGADLRGRVQVEGSAQVDVTEVQIGLTSRENLPMMGAPNAVVKPDHSFLIENIPDGSYRVAAFGAPPDVFVKAARYGSADVLETGLNIARGQSPSTLEVMLSVLAGRIDGTVVNQQQQPFAGASVVLVPDSPRREQFHLIQEHYHRPVRSFHPARPSPGQLQALRLGRD